VATAAQFDAVENPNQGKTIGLYKDFSAGALKNISLLKPGRWMTVEFSNTQAKCGMSFKPRSGCRFVVANVSALDKQKGSFKAMYYSDGRQARSRNLGLQANGGFEFTLSERGRQRRGSVIFVRTHLRYLPVTKRQGAVMDAIPERAPRILFDQVVAYFVRSGYTIANFQPRVSRRSGSCDSLNETECISCRTRFSFSNDEMRMTVKELSRLNCSSRTRSPPFNGFDGQLTEQTDEVPGAFTTVHERSSAVWDKHEQPVELRAILEENFVEDSEQ
jgi:hypothetical protein